MLCHGGPASKVIFGDTRQSKKHSLLQAKSCNMHPALLSNSDVNPSQQGHKTAYMSAAVRWKLPEL